MIREGLFAAITNVNFGHDLHDLKLLLEQTRAGGKNVYTHGEMRPAAFRPDTEKKGR